MDCSFLALSDILQDSPTILPTSSSDYYWWANKPAWNYLRHNYLVPRETSQNIHQWIVQTSKDQLRVHQSSSPLSKYNFESITKKYRGLREALKQQTYSTYQYGTETFGLIDWSAISNSRTNIECHITNAAQMWAWSHCLIRVGENRIQTFNERNSAFVKSQSVLPSYSLRPSRAEQPYGRNWPYNFAPNVKYASYDR